MEDGKMKVTISVTDKCLAEIRLMELIEGAIRFEHLPNECVKRALDWAYDRYVTNAPPDIEKAP